ncbi:MAG: PUA domain-containing protein, partial [Pseudomonadota bacterium]
PAGVAQIHGSFGRGDLVAIIDTDGAQLGQGLIRYTSAEARQIMGRRSADIVDILGYEGRAALVHRDDMVL